MVILTGLEHWGIPILLLVITKQSYDVSENKLVTEPFQDTPRVSTNVSPCAGAVHASPGNTHLASTDLTATGFIFHTETFWIKLRIPCSVQSDINAVSRESK